jgi:putative aminopeptidase FrvX
MDKNLTTVMELMRIPGTPGSQTQISDHVVKCLRDMGVPENAIFHDTAYKESEIGGEKGNLIVRFPGRSGETCRMLSTHMDTVPGAVGSEPKLEGDRVVNR